MFEHPRFPREAAISHQSCTMLVQRGQVCSAQSSAVLCLHEAHYAH